MSATSFVARTPTDLIAVTPHLLGFHPEESVVLITLGRPEGTFHARVDLPSDHAAQVEVAGLLSEAVDHNPVEAAAVLLYSTDAEASGRQAELLLDRLTGAGVRVIDVLRVEEGRYFRLLTGDPCGTPYDVSDHPLHAQRVYDGHVVHASREALAHTLVGARDDESAQVELAARRHARCAAAPGGEIANVEVEAAWVRKTVRRAIGEGQRLSASDAGRLLADCTDLRLRDVAWAEVSSGQATAWVELWRDLVRRSPPWLLPPAAALLAFSAWLSGDGALAWCALDRCAEVDDDYGLACRVADLLTAAVPPSAWEEVS